MTAVENQNDGSRSNAVPVADAAAHQGVSESTLRRWVSRGCPVVQQGRRGRGCAMLLDPEAVTHWRHATDAEAAMLEIASALPHVLADAIEHIHHDIENDPAKRRMAGLLAVAWYATTCAVLDRLRERCPSVPDVASLPEPIERLRKIAHG